MFNQLSLSSSQTASAIDKVANGKDNYFDSCYFFSVKFIKGLNTFASEDIIDAYNVSGNPLPKEPRVFGAVIRRLKREGLIVNDGTGYYKKPSGHGKPVNIWRVTANLK